MAVGDEIEGEIDLAFLEGLHEEHEALALANDIETDLAKLGPLTVYLQEVRSNAVAAVKKFTAIDIDDTAGLRDCQGALRAYIALMDFIKRSLINAEQAEQVIDEKLSKTEEVDD